MDRVLPGEKPFQCSKCLARFSDVSSRSRHEKEHENNKRFTCNLCNDTFKRTGQLRSHLTRKHHSLSAGEIPVTINSRQSTRQTRIVSLIKNLHSKTSNSQLAQGQGQSLLVLNSGNTMMGEGSHQGADSSREEGVPIELQGVEIPANSSEHSYITILNHEDGLDNKFSFLSVSDTILTQCCQNFFMFQHVMMYYMLILVSITWLTLEGFLLF